ncbi:hypothetical protein [Aeromonas allosaccharophila]|uniref:hypothetical protein n=1 Tax=Aeromonas allosaccharophila TaxID=656 RepID=UPI003D2141DD
MTVDEIIGFLRDRVANVACDGVDGLLVIMERLGFKCREASAGHRVFTHPELTKITNRQFLSHSINCDHKTRRPMPKHYVKDTMKLIEKYAEQLKEINGEKSNV